MKEEEPTRKRDWRIWLIEEASPCQGEGGGVGIKRGVSIKKPPKMGRRAPKGRRKVNETAAL